MERNFTEGCLKGNPHSNNKLTVNSVQILNFSSISRSDINSSVLKIRYDYRLLSILNFPGAAILDFMTSKAEVRLCETIVQPYYVMKFKMVAPGKFKMKLK